MLLKANLHLHTKEDPVENIDYTIYQAIDYAKSLGFQVLALTCHNQFVYEEKMGDYARARGILLIPGIEAKIEGRHVLIFACDKAVEEIKTFSQLREYKKHNLDVFAVAPHPFFPMRRALREKTERHIDVFDAIEMSWYYHRCIDFNKKAKKLARKYNKPYLATSDTHILEYLDRSYCLIEASEIDTRSIFEAIKKKNFENISVSLSWWEILKTRYHYIFKL